MKYVVAATTFLFLLTSVASFADHSHVSRKAEDAFNAGDYKTAVHLWQEEAERGELAAMEALGAIYTSGRVVPLNYSEAVKWHSMAAKGGSASSQYALCMLYYEGTGLEKSRPHAYAWCLVSASSGNVGAKRMHVSILKEMDSEEIEQARTYLLEVMQMLAEE